MFGSCRAIVAIIALGLALTAPGLVCLAAEPTVRQLNPHGLQVGGTTTLTVDGDALGVNPSLLLPFAVDAQLKPGATDKRAIFDVTLSSAIVPGYYQLRLVTAEGISLPMILAVDRLPQRLMTAKPDPLPVAIHGVIAGSTVYETSFTGKLGQKLQVEVEAQRLGSKLKPVVHLYDHKRRQLAWSWGKPALYGDTRLATTLPVDGTYTVTVHDAEYSAPGNGYFRLRLGEWLAIDQVYPPALSLNHPGTVELLGLSPTSRASLPAAKSVGFQPLAWPSAGLWSGPRPFIEHTTLVTPHVPSHSTPQVLPAVPVTVSGRLAQSGETHHYQLPVTPGRPLRFEVFAERHGSPLDVALVLKDGSDKLLVRGDDSPGTLDPVLDFTTPEKLESLRVDVVDAQGRGSPTGVYQLRISAADALGQGDYQLLTNASSISIPPADQVVLPVWIERRGYRGSVELTLDPLPAGLKLSGATIPATAEGTLLTLSADAGLSPQLVTLRSRESAGPGRTVMIKNHPLLRLQPWIASELALASLVAPKVDVSEKAPSPAAHRIIWNKLSADARLVSAGKLELPVLVDHAGDKQTVRLTLLTSQIAPLLVNNNPDLPKTIRVEKPIEIPADKREGAVTVLVPADLPSSIYDVSVQAEWLAADKRIVATRFTPVQRLQVSRLVAITLSADAKLLATRDKAGVTAKLSGKIERREGFKGDVTLALTGLPTGVKGDTAVIKADQTDFTLALVLPATTPAAELSHLKLSASVVPDPKLPAIRARSDELELQITIPPALKP